MKKMFTAVLSALSALALTAPAYADAAIPDYYYARRVFSGAFQWIIAILIAVVIVAVAIIIAVIRYKRKQNTDERAQATAEAKDPNDP